MMKTPPVPKSTGLPGSIAYSSRLFMIFFTTVVATKLGEARKEQSIALTMSLCPSPGRNFLQKFPSMKRLMFAGRSVITFRCRSRRCCLPRPGKR